MAEEIKVLCPWCNKGEVYIEGAGNANVSIKCPRCQHCFKLRLNDFSTVRIHLLSLMLSPLSLCTIIGSFFLFDFSKIWTHRKLPEAAAKIYHVKGSIPVSFTHITD